MTNPLFPVSLDSAVRNYNVLSAQVAIVINTDKGTILGVSPLPFDGDQPQAFIFHAQQALKSAQLKFYALQTRQGSATGDEPSAEARKG